MMRTIVLCCVIALEACGSAPVDGPSDPAALSTAVTVDCDGGWADCYRQAGQLCGQAGFEELDRHAGLDVVPDGRFEQMDSSARIYRGDAHVKETDRSLTIRCRRSRGNGSSSDPPRQNKTPP
jgi:hypothetical protein